MNARIKITGGSVITMDPAIPVKTVQGRLGDSAAKIHERMSERTRDKETKPAEDTSWMPDWVAYNMIR